MDDTEAKHNFIQDNQKSSSLDRKLLCYKKYPLKRNKEYYNFTELKRNYAKILKNIPKVPICMEKFKFQGKRNHIILK
jgi:hypothetical protein